MRTPDVKDILLADDDKDDVELFTIAANSTTIQIKLRVVNDGDELFKELEAKLPNVLFLDIAMPCKDGILCILEIRQNRSYDKLPVIMYSSFTHEKFVDDAYRRGANFYLAKPLTFAALTQRLQYLLSIDWENQMLYPSREQFYLS